MLSVANPHFPDATPYRKSLTHEKAMSILYEMSLKGEIDSKIADDINRVFIWSSIFKKIKN